MRWRLGTFAALAVVAAVAAVSFAPSAEAGWLPPTDISEPGSNVTEPHVALDSEGNATTVWSRWNGVDMVVEGSFRPAGADWGPPENLSEPEGGEEFTPGAHDAQGAQVVVDRNGNWTVIWERYAWPLTIIESVSRAPGGSWSEPVQIDAVPQGADPEPWLAVDSEGRNTAVWKDGEVIMSSFRQFPGEWEEPVPLSQGNSYVPQAAMDARGDAIAVWMHDDGTHYVVESSYRPEQGEWGGATLVSQPGEEAGNPHVAIDGKGDALVIWRGEDEGEERLRASYRLAGGEWEAPVDISSPGEQVQAPRAAVDPSGNAIAVWAGDRGELGGWDSVHASFQPVGGSWEEPVELSSAGGDGFPSDVVFDNSGNAAAIWERWDGISNLVQTAYRPAGEEWEQSVDLSEEGKQGMDARVVLDAPGSATTADGDATAVWISGTPSACPGEHEAGCSEYVVEAAGYDPDGLPAIEVQAPLEGSVGEPLEVATPTAGLYSPTIAFGDGEEAAAASALHAYDAPGEYQVTVGGAEELGYRASVERTIKIVPAGPGGEVGGGKGEGEGEKEGSSGEEPPAGGTESTAGASSGGSGAAPEAALGATPGQGGDAACEAAKDARAAAASALRQAGRKLAAADGRQAHRRLAAVKQRRRVALHQAQAYVAAAC